MRIGIIACVDTVIWGGEKGISSHIIHQFKEANDNVSCELIAFHAVSGHLPRKEDIESYDGFIISGSQYSVNDNREWIAKLIEFVLLVFKSERPRLFGICFGHQLIAKALKGQVEDNPSKKYVWCTECILPDDILVGKDFYEQSMLDQEQFTIMQSHGECVMVLPESAVCVGRSSTCDTEILMYGDKALSMQGHPDITRKEMMNRILPRLRSSKILSKQEEKRGIASLDDKDQLKLMKLVGRFLCRKKI